MCWQPLTDSYQCRCDYHGWESLSFRELSRKLHCGLGKELSNTVFNLSNNKNNASFGAESPHSNLSKFRAGQICQPLLHCCFILLWPCNMYNIHTRGILSHLRVLPSNNTFFLKEFLVRKQVLPIQNTHFVKLKRKIIPHPLRAVSDPSPLRTSIKKDSFYCYPWVPNNGKIWLWWCYRCFSRAFWVHNQNSASNEENSNNYKRGSQGCRLLQYGHNRNELIGARTKQAGLIK